MKRIAFFLFTNKYSEQAPYVNIHRQKRDGIYKKNVCVYHNIMEVNKVYEGQM
jgi:hypothetical protein